MANTEQQVKPTSTCILCFVWVMMALHKWGGGKQVQWQQQWKAAKWNTKTNILIYNFQESFNINHKRVIGENLRHGNLWTNFPSIDRIRITFDRYTLNISEWYWNLLVLITATGRTIRLTDCPYCSSLLPHHRPQWPRNLRHGSAAVYFLGLRVRIPRGKLIFVSC
jgi:hypothetical protein